MRAARVEALTPFPLASSANCFFHASKPAAVLPHCAAPALLVIHTSATRTATATVLTCRPSVIPNSFHALCIRRNTGSPSLPGRGVIAGSRAVQDPSSSLRRWLAPESLGQPRDCLGPGLFSRQSLFSAAAGPRGFPTW